jgi:hypothetical protein
MKKILSNLIPILLILGMGYIVYSAVFPLHAAKATKQPWTVLTKQVVPGGVLKYEAAVCKYTNAKGTLTRQIYGVESKYINTEPSNIPKGCVTNVRTVTLPEDTQLGKYHLIITAEYHINSFHTDTVIFETEEFEVVSPDAPNAPKPNTPGGVFTKSNPQAPSSGSGIIKENPPVPSNTQTNINTQSNTQINTQTNTQTPKLCLPLVSLCIN